MQTIPKQGGKDLRPIEIHPGMHYQKPLRAKRLQYIPPRLCISRSSEPMLLGTEALYTE